MQVNGKVRDRLTVPAGAPGEEIKARARQPASRADLDGKQVRKLIAVPGKLVNIVIG